MVKKKGQKLSNLYMIRPVFTARSAGRDIEKIRTKSDGPVRSYVVNFVVKIMGNALKKGVSGLIS